MIAEGKLYEMVQDSVDVDRFCLGGTGLGHEVDMARSRNITGSYESNPSNPVLTNANTTQYGTPISCQISIRQLNHY